jgi:hypothetical protein
VAAGAGSGLVGHEHEVLEFLMALELNGAFMGVSYLQLYLFPHSPICI